MSDSTVGKHATEAGGHDPADPSAAPNGGGLGSASDSGKEAGFQTPGRQSPKEKENTEPENENKENIGGDEATVITAKATTPGHATGDPSTTDLGQLLEGQQLNHFRLDAFVGGGGMGAVFRGTDTALGRTVAIKVLLQQYSNDEETTLRFQNEAQSTARLDHENIARVYYVGEDRGWHYIVLEYIEGDNIRDLVYRDGPLKLEATVNYTLQIADALEHASSRDVVHRDIKPSNVLIRKNQRVKLVDMGLARLHQVDNSHEDLTATGVTLGTFDYISPEQARDPRNADVRSDLYSLGCTVYFMLTAEPPFPEGTVLQKLLQHQGDKPPDPQAIRPELPQAICEVTKKLLSKNPQDRYQTPLELSADLVLLAAELDLKPLRNSSVVMTPTALSPSWTVRHLPWMVPTALLLLIALLVHYTSRPPGEATRAQGRPAGGNLSRQKIAVSDRSVSTANPSQQKIDQATAGLPTPGIGGGRQTQKIPTIPPASRNADLESRENKRETDDQSSADTDLPGTSPEASDRPTLDEPGSGEKLLLVDGSGNRANSFASVADACRKATSGSVIELNYNGRLAEADQPILLAQRKLTIRAGEGKRPVIRFRPQGPDRALYPRSMITIAGGSLTLSNVHLELEIPAHARSEGWTLFEAVLADQIRLERCTLTIRNIAGDLSAMYRDVSFFNVQTAPGRDRPLTVDGAAPAPRVNIQLRDCVVRGEAVFLRGNALFSVQLQWENGLLATTESFVEIDAQSAALPEDEQLVIDLQHVTALMEAGFCRMSSGDDQRRLTPIRIDCTDSILMTDGAPLIEQSGPAAEEDFRRLIQWNADRSFYEHVDTFWRIDSLKSTMASEWDWERWQNFWGPGRERSERPPPVLWTNRPADDQPVSAQHPDDYALSANSKNPARSAATDGMSDAGFQILSLPEIPPSLLPPAGLEWSPADDLPGGR